MGALLRDLVEPRMTRCGAARARDALTPACATPRCGGSPTTPTRTPAPSCSACSPRRSPATADAAADLADRMAGTLRFGTAGLRGPVRAGPNGMNRAVVRRTTAGLARWLRARGPGRRRRSWSAGTPGTGREAFAAATAEVLAGGRVRRPGAARPAAHAGARVRGPRARRRRRGPDHRLAQPAADNGYKVYVDDGGQLAPPADTRDRGRDRRGAAGRLRAPSDRAHGDRRRSREAYLDRVAAPAARHRRGRCGSRSPRCTASAARPRVLALARAGFTDVHVVAAQAEPDPRLPDRRLPEPGGARRHRRRCWRSAERVGADLAVALDPDADRCALGVPTPDGWRMLTGDETGALLGDHILRHAGSRSIGWWRPRSSRRRCSRSIAAAYGARFAETLTGFKWIARAGAGLVYGYEEALGYCVDPDAVRDKDGISAAVLACRPRGHPQGRGRGLLDRLDELADRARRARHRGAAGPDGPGRARRRRCERLRARPRPPTLARRGGDGRDRSRRRTSLVLRPRGEERVVIRPSGTEPKLKAYLQVVEPVSGDLPAARAAADARLHALRAEVEAMIGGPGSGGGDHRV